MRRLLERAALDARSLAVCRIGVGLLLLVDLAQRASDLRAFYTDEGVLPRSAYQLSQWDFAWSAHRLAGSAGFEAALFAIAAVFALALLVGYRTCWATLGSWLLAVSLHGRNPLLRDGQDDLMRVLLFWALFLPWGAVASLDARAGRRSHPLQTAGASVAAWGALGFVLQLCVVYWVSGLGKLLSPWWRSGDGIFYAMHVGRYQTGLGRWLGEQPGLPLFSFAVMALELGGPIAWLALRDGRARALVAAAFILMHAAFVATIRLGLFPWVSMVAWTALLPPW
ncbi:MAG TPA: HTTM domain-containing protein, partial [Myxococcaceae bacterium]|nr:HTTM domain-containing protein [Myxococcaceae bacterium]